MDTLIKRKTLRAKQGKQRWRKNIDTSVLQHQILENKGFYDEPIKKIKGETLSFTIDKTKSNVDYSNINRFKKAPTDPKLLSKYEQKQIKILSKTQNLNVSTEPQQNHTAGTQDVWVDHLKKKRPMKLERPKFIMRPSGGQSYNPSQDDHQKLLDSVVESEIKAGQKNIKVNINKVQNMEMRELRRKELVKLLKLEREQGQKALNTLVEKKKNHSFNLIKKLKKEQQEQRERLNIKRQGKTLEKETEQKSFKVGRLPRPKKIGRKTVKLAQEDFLTDEQLPEKLRSLVAGDKIIHSHFESFFRRGLLEPKGISNKLRSSKIPKYRIKDKADPFAPKIKDDDAEEEIEIKI